jgi:hypothetical protein
MMEADVVRGANSVRKIAPIRASRREARCALLGRADLLGAAWEKAPIQTSERSLVGTGIALPWVARLFVRHAK